MLYKQKNTYKSNKLFIMFVRLEKVDKKVITQEKYLILLFIYFLTNGVLQTHHSDHDRHNRRQNRNRRRCCRP